MLKLLFAIVIIVFIPNATFAFNEGKYKVGEKTYTYTSETRGKQTAYIFEPALPDNLQSVYDAVRFGISLTYGKDKLSAKEPDIVDVKGVKFLKFRSFLSKGANYVMVIIVRNKGNRVNAFSMFESDD